MTERDQCSLITPLTGQIAVPGMDPAHRSQGDPMIMKITISRTVARGGNILTAFPKCSTARHECHGNAVAISPAPGAPMHHCIGRQTVRPISVAWQCVATEGGGA